MPTARAGVVCLAIIVATIAGGRPRCWPITPSPCSTPPEAVTLAAPSPRSNGPIRTPTSNSTSPDEKGGIKHWSVELGSPSILMQSGWKFSDLKVGDKVTVVISPLRSGQPGGLLAQITLPDGRVLGNGPAPEGGRRHWPAGSRLRSYAAADAFAVLAAVLHRARVRCAQCAQSKTPPDLQGRGRRIAAAAAPIRSSRPPPAGPIVLKPPVRKAVRGAPRRRGRGHQARRATGHGAVRVCRTACRA